MDGLRCGGAAESDERGRGRGRVGKGSGISFASRGSEGPQISVSVAQQVITAMMVAGSNGKGGDVDLSIAIESSSQETPTYSSSTPTLSITTPAR